MDWSECKRFLGRSDQLLRQLISLSPSTLSPDRLREMDNIYISHPLFRPDAIFPVSQVLSLLIYLTILIIKHIIHILSLCYNFLAYMCF